jgi:TRAP-type C4-dicarboxylate transport system substrate-binding protein
MKGKRFLMVVGGLFLALMVAVLPLIGACAPKEVTPPPEEVPPSQPIKLSLVTFLPKMVPLIGFFMTLIDRINEKAKGELVIEYLGGPEVVGMFDQAMAVKMGSVDMACSVSAFYEGLVPVGDILLMSQISLEEERQRGVIDLLRDLHEEAGIYFIARSHTYLEPHFYMAFIEPFETPSDLAGRKLGAAGVHVRGPAEALGMHLTIVAQAEAYTALERGVVDGWSTPPDTHVSLGLIEVVKYTIDHPYFGDNCTWIMNLDKWNGLPEHLQDLMLDTYLEMEDEIERVEKAESLKNIQLMKDAGIEFIKFSPEDAEWFIETIYRTKWEDLCREMPEVGPKFKELLSP